MTPVLLKTLEHILNSRHKVVFQETQFKLLKGFTAGCSSLIAALILSECIVEASNTKHDLFFITIDTYQKCIRRSRPEFSVLLALRLPRLGKRELILVPFVRLFDLRLFGFVCCLFLLVSGKGCDL